MPPLPTVRSASTAEPFAHHVGRTCHQGQNPKNHNRKASACLPIFFLFCLPFVCPFACPFFFHDCKKSFVFNGYNHVFVCPFVCPFLPAQASRHTIAHNLKTRRETCSLLVVYKTASSPNHCNTRLSGRILLVNLLVSGWSFRWSVADMLAFQSIMPQGFPLAARWSFRWSLVCCSFVVLLLFCLLVTDPLALQPVMV